MPRSQTRHLQGVRKVPSQKLFWIFPLFHLTLPTIFFQLIDKYTKFLFIGRNFKSTVQRYPLYFKYKNLMPFYIYIGRLIFRTSILQLKCNPKIWNFYHKLFLSSPIYLQSFGSKFELRFFTIGDCRGPPQGSRKKSKFEFWPETLQIYRAWWE